MHACLDQILERVLCKQLGAHIITLIQTRTPTPALMNALIIIIFLESALLM